MPDKPAPQRYSPLSTPAATRAVLERHGLYTKYALGQNFLVNDDIIRKIIDLAAVDPTDRILEVGPGIGTLTAALLPRAAHVTAVEKDRDLPAVLADTLAPWADRFTLVNADALDLPSRPDLLAPNTFTKLVSNLPYAVAATVTLGYFQSYDFLESATVMVQKEVADRMCARPGTKAYGAYTVKLAFYAEPVGRFPVSPGSFFPPPHVESAVLRLNRIQPPADPATIAAACQFADAAFANRRKTLANSCKTYFANRPDILADLPSRFARAGIDPRRRGETLTPTDYLTLAK